MATANLVVNLLGRTSQFDRSMNQGRTVVSRFVGEVKLMGSTISRVFQGIGSAAAGLGLAFGFRQALEGATQQIQAERKLAAVLKSTGNAVRLTQKEIQDYASELQSLTNFGDEVTLNAAAQLATFTSITGDAFLRGLAAAQDMATVMDTDLRSSIVQIGKVLNDPVRNLSALGRAGVQFTQAQRELITSLAQSGDLLGAQNIVLKELERQFGGTAKAMADPVVQLKNAIGDVLENIGHILLPSVREIATKIGVWATEGANAREQFEAIGESLKNDIVPAFENLVEFGRQLARFASLTQQDLSDAMAAWVRARAPDWVIRILEHPLIGLPRERFPMAEEHFLPPDEFVGPRLPPEKPFDAEAFAGPVMPEALAKEREALEKFARDIARDVRTPFEVFQDQVTELQKAADLGLFADAPEAFARAIVDARDDFLKSVPKTPARDVGGPAALERNSREALSAIFGAGRREDAQKQVAKNTEKANKLAEKVIGGIKGVEKAVEGLVNNFPVADIEG